jgi:hypothetical protein
MQLEALLQLVDLRRQCRRIGGIAFEHLDRDRATIRRAQQTDHQVRAVTPMVAAVAVARQFAAAPFQIRRGDIVEQQSAVPQMPPRQARLDEALLAAQPVECGVHLSGGDPAKPQHLAQGMARRGRIKHPRGRQFGRGIEHSGDDQRQRQIAPPLPRAARQQRIQFDAARGGQRGEHVAVRQRAGDLHRIRGRQ